MSEEFKTELQVFRVSPRERRELAPLAQARGVTKSDLLRSLVRQEAERVTGPKEQ